MQSSQAGQLGKRPELRGHGADKPLVCNGTARQRGAGSGGGRARGKQENRASLSAAYPLSLHTRGKGGAEVS